MYPDPDSPIPPLSATSISPTQSWTQDSTFDDSQHQTTTQSDAPGSSTVFEKKWIVTEIGDSGTSFFRFCVARLLCSPSVVLSQEGVSFASILPKTTTTTLSSSLFVFQGEFQDGALEKNHVFFDPNLDDSSETETTGGTYLARCCFTALRTLTMSLSP